VPASIWFVDTDFVTKFVDRDDPVAGPRHKTKYDRLAPRFLDSRVRSIAYLISYYPIIKHGEPHYGTVGESKAAIWVSS
jgi:hypothetical protein